MTVWDDGFRWTPTPLAVVAPPSRTPRTPTVAILTVRDARTRRFRGNRARFIALLDAAQRQGMTAYIVTHDQLNIDGTGRKPVTGYGYHATKKRWFPSSQPFPHIVYNRIPFRTFERQPAIQRLIRTCLRHPHVHFFNPGFLSKWRLFEWLMESPRLRPLLPETIQVQQATDIDALLQKHAVLYLKPITGRAGKGIVRIRKVHRTKTPLYEMQTQTEAPQRFNLNSLTETIRAHIGNTPYIAQQGIALATSAGRPFDLRALVQKDGNGRWQVSGIGARVAGKNRITTHVPRGGSIGQPLSLLTGVFGATQARALLRRVRQQAVHVAQHIEQQAGNTWGELSMDLGIDRQGNLWFFEANAKPMTFNEPNIQRKSTTRLVQYWRHLAQQPKRSAVLHAWPQKPVRRPRRSTQRRAPSVSPSDPRSHHPFWRNAPWSQPPF